MQLLENLLDLILVIDGFLLFAFLVPAVLALPTLKREAPRVGYYRALVLCLFGIWIPMVVFVLRGGLTPVSKSQARGGWLDCFGEGSIWLFPLVVFASWGFHRVLVATSSKTRHGFWTVSAIAMGVIVSWGCTLFWFYRVWEGGRAEASVMILVPLYVAIWYLYLGLRLWRESGRGIWEMVFSVLLALPFWVASVRKAKLLYAALPETTGDCFVVTAAKGGHECVVGPFFEVERRGERRIVNLQLVRFWRFEAVWKLRYPKMHSLFRAFYNRVGPIAAGFIRRGLMADTAYLMLKPLELASVVLLRGKRVAVDGWKRSVFAGRVGSATTERCPP